MSSEHASTVERTKVVSQGGDATGTAAPPGPGRTRRPAIVIAAALVLLATVYGGYRYVWSLSHETTDDAQVEGHIHAISSRVSGYVAEVCVQDNQIVAKGDVLARVRPEDYQARVTLAEGNLAEAQAGLSVAEHSVDVLRGQTAAAIDQVHADIQQAQAQYAATQRDADSAAAKLTAAEAGRQQALSQARAAQAEFDYARFSHDRIAALREHNEAAEDEAQLAESKARAAEAQLTAAQDWANLSEAQVSVAQHGLDAAKAAIAVAEAAIDKQKARLEDALTGPDQVRVAEAKVAVARGTVDSARSQLDLAKIDLVYCTIIAPAAGLVTKRSVELGQFLQPGQPLLAIVPLDDTWVVANFKETELQHMRIGQPALLRIDAYPDHPIEGYIDGLAAGTGARFSLLPPENATGNFVKVVQRVPVKIVVRDGQRNALRPLRPGMNVVVTVDTKPHTPDPAPSR